MGFIGRLFGGKAGTGSERDADGIHLYVRCNKCGEKLHIRANKRTDVAQEYDQNGEHAVLMLHKEILGSRCQNLMYVHLVLDASYGVSSSNCDGCSPITRADFDEAP